MYWFIGGWLKWARGSVVVSAQDFAAKRWSALSLPARPTARPNGWTRGVGLLLYVRGVGKVKRESDLSLEVFGSLCCGDGGDKLTAW
jgi:hypothetical protein